MGLCFGSYLSSPVTEKESTDDTNDKLVCGASSMQGWRVSQEDAHNCILDYDTNTSFFAVYDGHGGHEVAQYCSEKLPDFIKDTSEYKENKIEEALKFGFLKFDGTIATPDVIEVLKKMAATRKDEAEESDEEENVNNLYEEAAMPIEQVLEKYSTNLVAPGKKDSETSDDPSVACSSSKTEIPNKSEDGSSSTSEETNGSEQPKTENEHAEKAPVSDSTVSNSESKVENVTPSEKKEESPVQNGEISTASSESQTKTDEVKSSTPVVENGTSSKKGKGKAIIKPEPVKSSPNTRPKRNAQQLYKQWLDFGEDSEDSDEEDQTFEGPNEESSDEEGDGVNIAIDASEDSSEEEEEENEDVEEEDEDDDENMAYTRGMDDEPGSESGCTAVVALLKGNELYVANAGDSRCIVCRQGKAIEMSVDHKPESDCEMERILKAGGRVTSEGRVNGGLNLSRAIGDHSYKQNKELSDQEQMITALPDIKTLTINPSEDEFMVLACDGIWNSMSSQEVVDFVRPRMLEGRERLSQICEEMFDHCLSADTLNDGTGCDNMTAIIVKFKSHSNKRAMSPCQPESSEKRARTETDSEAQVDTTA